MQDTAIHTYTAPDEGRVASSHYFVTPQGLFLFDAQLHEDDARQLLDEMAEKEPGVAVAALFVTGQAPEHWATASILAQGKTRLAMSRETARAIARKGEARVVATESIGAHEVIKFKGLTIELVDMKKEMGWGNVVCFVRERRQLITGDMVYNRVHPNLTRIDIDKWSSALESLKRFRAKYIFPGYGPPAAGELLSHLQRYLDHFRVAVNYFSEGDRALGPDVVKDITVAMADKYPDYHLIDNLEQSIAGEVRHRQKAA